MCDEGLSMSVDNSQAFLDREYSPRLLVANHAEYFSRWAEEGKVTRAEMEPKVDLRYGSEKRQTLDYFGASKVNAPLLVFIHGGFWRAFDKSDFSWVAKPYVARGAAVAIVNYGLAPDYGLRQIVEHIRQACAWLYLHAADLGFDQNRMHCAGHSAGAHLTAMMLTTDWKSRSPQLSPRMFASAVGVSGVYELAPLMSANLRRDLKLDDIEAALLSPAHLRCLEKVPVLVAVGNEESGEFLRHPELLRSAWGPCVVKPPLVMNDKNHFSACDSLAEPDSALFQATNSLIQAPAV
jgi:arylformamidase